MEGVESWVLGVGGRVGGGCYGGWWGGVLVLERGAGGMVGWGGGGWVGWWVGELVSKAHGG